MMKLADSTKWLLAGIVISSPNDVKSVSTAAMPKLHHVQLESSTVVSQFRKSGASRFSHFKHCRSIIIQLGSLKES
jgi:hypothetical protein